MININNVIKEKEITNAKVIEGREKEGLKGHKYTQIEIHCEYCEQTFNDDLFNLSVFLYGTVLLIGENYGHIGFTCPVCLKTNMLKGDNLVEIMKTIVVFMGPNGSQMNPSPKYHSSVLFSPSQIDHLDSYDIPTWTCPLSEDTKDNFHGMLDAKLKENEFSKKGYLCSYNYGGDFPIGVMFSIWWFKQDDIESVLEIENEQGVRVFPRYVHEMEWFKRYDYFCWKYKLYQDYLTNLNIVTNEDFGMLREYAYQQDINLDRLLESNPSVANTTVIEFAQQHAQNVATNDIQAASEFLDLLVNFNPPPWDIPGEMSDCFSKVWKAINPFEGASIPACYEELGQTEFDIVMTDIEVKTICDKVRPKCLQTVIQEWAVEHHQDFINEFISLARRSDFSYGLVWDLKCRYLKELYKISSKNVSDTIQFGFFDENGSWRIIFEGKHISNLKGNGFRYLFHLVSNPDKEIDVFDLGSVDGNSAVEFVDTENTHREVGIDHPLTAGSAASQCAHDIADDETRSIIMEVRKEAQAEIHDAEKLDDQAMLKEAKDKLDKVNQAYSEMFRHGKSRQFDDGTLKERRRIVKAIERALSSIRGKNPAEQNKLRKKAWAHFHEALKPISLYKMRYRSNPEINWSVK